MTLSEVAPYLVQGLTFGAIFGLLAMSLSLVYRMSETVNFTAGDLMSLGALFGGVSLLTSRGVPAVLAIMAALAIGGVVSIVVYLLIEPPGRKKSHDGHHDIAWVITVVAASIVIEQLASLAWGGQSKSVRSMVGDGAFEVFNTNIRKSALLVIVIAVVVAIILDLALSRTRWGLRIRAVGNDRIGSLVAGINHRLLHIQVFFVGGMVAGLTGVLAGPLLSASPFGGFTVTIQAFIASVIGGLGSVRGAIIGGFVLGMIDAFAGGFFGAQWETLFSLGLLVLLLIVSPTGILPGRAVRRV